jgi:hypothetical protein
MINGSDKICRKYQNTHFIFTFFFQNRAVYEMRKIIVVQRERSQMTIWRMRIACWIPMLTNTHSECAIRMALPLQEWLHECTQCYVIRPLSFLLFI